MVDEKEILRAHASAMGKKGGRARADALSPEQRSAIARKGGKARAKARKQTKKESK